MFSALVVFLTLANDLSAPVPSALTPDGVPAISESLSQTLSRYGENRSAALLDWDPDSRALLISTRFGDVPQLHRVAMPGGARTQLTFFPDRITGAQYSPQSGASFLFSKDSGGDEFFQLYRFDVATGSVTLLTDGKSRNTQAKWSRDGKRIAFSSTRRNGRDTDIWTMNPMEPTSARMALQVEGGGWAVEDWAPDGTHVLVEEYRSINDSSLYLADLNTGAKQLLTSEKAAYSQPRFSAEGTSIYLITNRGQEFSFLASLGVKTGKVAKLSGDLNHDVEELDVTRDGSRIAYVVNNDGFSDLHIYDIGPKREVALAQIPKCVISGLKWNRRGDELGFSLSSASSSLDVFSVRFTPGASGGRVERWTTSETGGLNPETFAKPDLIHWKSFDDRQISGILYRPPAKFSGKHPVIINIHGGPEGESRPIFNGRINYFIDELGIAVIFPNVRGSSGFGKAFLDLDNGIKREDSVKDIGALLDWIAAQPDLDASRVMVTGGSYGGYMTLASMFHYNDRFRCAVDIVGISNFQSFLKTTQAYRQDLRRVEYGDERDPKMQAFFQEVSPLRHASSITKPMFIVAGRNDPRVPWQEGQQMTEAIRKNGAPVWFLIGENEGHGFAHKQNQDYQFAATALFVQNYLLK